MLDRNAQTIVGSEIGRCTTVPVELYLLHYINTYIAGSSAENSTQHSSSSYVR